MKVLFVLAALCTLAFGYHLKPRHPRLDGRIVGGHDTNIEELPHQLSLQLNGGPYCGASIISAYWAIAACHCVYRKDSAQFSVRAGSSISNQGGEVIQVVETICHQQYNDATTDYDFAIIKLSRPLNLGQPGIQAIALADQEPSEGTTCIASGWGALWSGGPYPNHLQSVEIPIIRRSRCQELYPRINITNRMICAAKEEGGIDACQGDSGGPLISGNRLVGIVSWGTGCAYPGYPGVYSNVADQRDWIRSISGV